MSDCLFCKIIDQTVPAKIVHSDERAVAFADINPTAPMHVLVVPRKHIESINDISAEDEADMGYLYRVAAKIAREQNLAERGYRTVMNCNQEAGQSVFHVHLHVVGGKHLGWPPFPRG